MAFPVPIYPRVLAIALFVRGVLADDFEVCAEDCGQEFRCVCVCVCVCGRAASARTHKRARVRAHTSATRATASSM